MFWLKISSSDTSVKKKTMYLLFLFIGLTDVYFHISISDSRQLNEMKGKYFHEYELQN